MKKKNSFNIRSYILGQLYMHDMKNKLKKKDFGIFFFFDALCSTDTSFKLNYLVKLP